MRCGEIGFVDRERLAVRNVWCVGRNYAAHAREMGDDPSRTPPLFFSKPASAVVSGATEIPYPPHTTNLHHEVELVVAIGQGGADISTAAAVEHVAGYAVGLDLTRRCAQDVAKKAGRPWALAKGFDLSGPVGTFIRLRELPIHGRIELLVNNQRRQEADLDEMIWSVAEVLAELSRFVALQRGDVIFTGTPAGVGKLVAGDELQASIDGLPPLSCTITESRR